RRLWRHGLRHAAGTAVVVAGERQELGEEMSVNPTSPPHGSERGLSLVECVLAILVLTVLAIGLLPLGVFATTTTENQGHLAARTTEYAQDKLEQLLGIQFGDTTTDTRVFPAADNGGPGLTAGGSSDPTAPVDQYCDYLDVDGTLLAGAAGAE